jgi:hypothetical protein
MISFELGIILTILIKLAECEWVQYGIYNFNIPGHIYKVTLQVRCKRYQDQLHGVIHLIWIFIFIVKALIF